MLGLPTEGEGDLKGIGEFFLLCCYGYILFRAAVLIGDGSEKLLLIYGPGLVGGLIIPILGAVPDGAIVLVSGLGSGDIQSQIDVGVGTLAGSTIMLLTIPWSLSILLGYRDKDPKSGEAATYPGTTKPKRENPFSLTGSVVTTFSNTPFGAKVMMVTSLSYLIVAVPAAIYKGASDSKKQEIEQTPALVGMIVCACAFVAYSIYQIYDSHAQTQQEMAQQKLKFLKWKRDIGKKFGNTVNATRAVFDKFDKDNNGTIDRQELRDGFAALGLNCSRQQTIEIMNAMNVDDDADTLTFDEFSEAIKKWGRVLVSNTDVRTGRASARLSLRDVGSGLTPRNKREASPLISTDEENDDDNNNTSDSKKRKKGGQNKDINLEIDTKDNNNDDNNKTISEKEMSPVTGTAGGKGNIQSSSDPLLKAQQKSYHTEIGRVDENAATDMTDDKQHLLNSMWRELESEEEEEEEDLLLEMSNVQLLGIAISQLLFGTILVTIFSDPMVDVINNFSDTINVSAFFVSFVVTPMASNASEIYSALVFAAKKSTEGISLGFSALYGAACMNNTFVLCIFCAIIYFQDLEWTFLVETMVILLTIVVVGYMGWHKTVEAWKAFVVLAMFPLSLLLVAVLEDPLDD